MSRRLAKASEVRELFDLRSNARVYELARRSMLPGVIRLGRQVRFDMNKIQVFIEEGGHQPLDRQKSKSTRSEARVSAE